MIYDSEEGLLLYFWFVFCSYGDAEESNSEQVRWRSVEQCTFIQQTECDVSQETFNLEEDYYARVKAVGPHTDGQSIWTETATRFRPMTDSEFNLHKSHLRKVNFTQ